MGKEQIIKRMNPEQLAKLNGPKTEVADMPHVYGGDTKTLVEETNLGSFPEELVSAKMVWMDFSKTPVEEVEMPRIDGPLTNVVGKMTGPNEYTYEGPMEELVELKTRMNEEAEDIKSLKLGPGMREQLKDENLMQHFSPLSTARLVATTSGPKSKKKKHRR